MAEQRKVKAWFTFNGVHIPIFEDSVSKGKESRPRTYKVNNAKSVSEYNERVKAKQLADAEKTRIEEEKKHKPEKPKKLLKELPLNDIPAEVANKTTDVLDLRTRKRFRFQEGSTIIEVIAFAGKGCLKPYRQAQKYAERWGGKTENWQHCAGLAQITDGRRTLTREVHWSQEENGVMREAFIKYYDKNDKKKEDKQ